MTKARVKLNTEILDDDDLGDIRKRLGAKDAADTSRDKQINAMSAEELIAKKSGWELGDESWAEGYIGLYRRLVAAGVKTKPLTDEWEDE